MVFKICVTAEKKLFWRLSVLVLNILYRLPEGRSPQRLYAGREESFTILLACFLICDMHRFWREGRLVMIMCSADLTSL